MNPFDLSNKVALVTGGNGGIGLGMAKGLASSGAAIVVAGRDAKKNAGAADALGKQGTPGIAVQVAVRGKVACQKVFDAALSAFGRIDIPVNNAGTNTRKQPQAHTLEEWHTVSDTNLPTAFISCQPAYPVMAKAGGGKVITT